MKPITVRVTKDDIKNGKREDPKSCPIARAVRRRLGHRFVRAAHGFLAVKDGRGAMLYYDAPSSYRDFIDRFDGGKFVRPFTVEFTFDC